jgi:hypothetical protein
MDRIRIRTCDFIGGAAEDYSLEPALRETWDGKSNCLPVVFSSVHVTASASIKVLVLTPQTVLSYQLGNI